MTPNYLILSFFILFLSSTLSFGQSNPAEVKFGKVKALLGKNKIEAAEKKLDNLLEEYPDYGAAWDMKANIMYYHYQESEKTGGLLGNLTVTTKDENGNEIPAEEDSLAAQLMSLLTKFSPAKVAYSKYLYTLRKATLLSNTAYNSAINIRNTFRVPKVDTLVSRKALKFYNQAEEAFAAKNYNKAAKLYKRALDEQPDFYKAQLYLADSYYFLKYYTEAIKYFKECSERYPMFLEPRKYLVDAYGKEGLLDKALEEAINSMLIYPDLSNFAKFEDLVYMTNERLEVSWEPRLTFPNAIELDEEDINTYSNPDTVPPGSWKFYVDALDELEEYCDDSGLVIRDNDVTDSRYLEVYSWEKMLKNAPEEEFAQARKMQQLGYLDCYVFITCFHDDIYDQYKHFVTNNKDKVLQYFNQVVIQKS